MSRQRDRLQGARELLAKCDYRPLFTITDLGMKSGGQHG